MSGGGQAESRVDRRGRARALAGFFTAGATLTTTVLLLPGWDGMHVAGLVGTVLLASLGALTLFARAERLGPSVIHAMTASGTVLIGACQILARGGSPTAMYAMLYIWVILHASLFFSRAAVAAHLGLTTLAHVVALVVLGEVESLAPQLALTLGTQVAAALVVSSLATRQRELADTDSLTGLGNRRVVGRALEWALARSRRAPSSPTCVALLDLDGFKTFNDQRGHLAGDLVLIEAAAAWRELVRSTDTLTRTGGDEFTLVLAECHLEEAERIVRRMIAHTPSAVTCSAGLARWDGRETSTTLIDRADKALYTAKAHGGLAIAPDAPGIRSDEAPVELESS